MGAGMGGMGGGFGGQNRRAPTKGADIAYTLRVPFTDAANARDQRLTLSDGKTIDLKIPAGVEDGTQLRLKGRGASGPAGAGDAIVTIKIERHSFFRREGDDVRLELPITLDEALHGAKVKCPTVDGAVMLTLRPTTNSGTVMRLKGKGFTKKDGAKGDQLVSLAIHLPENADGLAQKLAGWRDDGKPRAKLGI